MCISDSLKLKAISVRSSIENRYLRKAQGSVFAKRIGSRPRRSLRFSEDVMQKRRNGMMGAERCLSTHTEGDQRRAAP